MKKLKGKYSEAIVFTNNIENTASEQIIELCNQEFTKGCNIRIMPDCHAGKGCVIGFTADLGNKVIPNLIGVDVGCGMLTVSLGSVDIDMAKLDSIIRTYIPSGFDVHNSRQTKFPKLQQLKCIRDINNTKRIERSIGTLGGGNHFIEIGIDNSKNKYLIIHSGSRNLGTQIAKHYQKIAINQCKDLPDLALALEKVITKHKNAGTQNLISDELKKLKQKYANHEAKYPDHLCFLTDKNRDNYLNDMSICQEYANLNRIVMANTILDHLFGKNIHDFYYFQTIHNYVNFEDNIIRKGAISAKDGELVLIPINMRDGSILARGKGNPNWNYSAPHGAGAL